MFNVKDAPFVIAWEDIVLVNTANVLLVMAAVSQIRVKTSVSATSARTISLVKIM
jgi:hypothetical protein